MSGAHRIEVSPNNRAGCKNTECKREGIKVQKGQLRYGTFITGPEWQSWAWKHWGCVTPKQISNLKTSIEGDPSQLDGYEELPEDLQKKVVNALEQGHIDDEDWGWDIEMNREGKNGYLTLESKRRLKAEAEALNDGAAVEGTASPGKTDSKKRGHVKDDPDAEDAVNDEPPAKKSKARTKKEPKVKNEDADRESGNEGSSIKKTKPRIKKEPKIKNEADETRSENEGPVNKKTKAAVKKGKKVNSNEADADFEQGAQPVKKGHKRVKKAITEDEAALNIKDESSDHDAVPTSKGKKARAKKATTEDEAALNIKDEISDHDAVPPSKGKKARAPRKPAAAKKIKDEDTETDGLDPASEHETPLGNVKLAHASESEPETSEDAPKPQKGRKKAPKKAPNGLAEKAKKETKPKAKSAAPQPNGRVTRSHRA